MMPTIQPAAARARRSGSPVAERKTVRRLLWRFVALGAIMVALFSDGTRAQRENQTGLENFDVRLGRDDISGAYRQRATAGITADARANRTGARAEGMTRLQAALGGVDVEMSPELGSPEIISARPGTGFLTEAAPDRVAAMRTFLSTYADAYGLSAAEVGRLVPVADYMNPTGNMGWVEFEQRINGLPVFRGLIRGGFTANGELARTTGALATNLEGGSLSSSSAFTAVQAVARAAASVGWVQDASALRQTAAAGGKFTVSRGTMSSDAKAWQVYFPVAPGVARLAWATEIWSETDVYMILLDAEDGSILFRKNLTNYQTQSASYNIYNNDSPAPLSPSTVLPGSGTQAAYIARTTIVVIGNEAPNTFNNLGWMNDGVNGGNGWTDGNNVQSGLDKVGPDGVDAVVSGVGRVFNFTYDPQTEEPGTTVAFQNGEVTDQFYWSNVYHDRLYVLGFTEPARNFQNDNFGRGGVGLDRVSAEAQDSSGTNNANFSTPSDGGRGRMQMYLFTGPTPDRTSALDHDVLIHELTHGTSNRLHNNAAGLTTTMSGGMGEGWSDFYARALLSSAAEDVNGIYSTGGWVTNLATAGYVDNYYYGIRRFPYAVKTNLGINGKPHNPLTFADIDPAQIDVTDGAYPRGPFGSSSAFAVHNIGEVWCVALLEVRARFIARLGYATGNQRILQFVTDGMKLDPVNPTLLQGRDSIIAAANAGGGTGADIADIWAGFATRGMGFGASVTNAGTGTVVQSFAVPGIVAGTSSITAESIPNGRLDPTEVVTVSLCANNTSGATSGSVTGTLQATGGVTSPSGAQVYGAIASGASTCKSFSFTVSAVCGATVTATLAITEVGGPSKNLIYTFQVGTPSGAVALLSQNFDGVVAPALPAGWTSSTLTGTANNWVTNATTPDTAPNRAFVANLGVVSDSAIVSPVIALPAGLSTLTFRNSWVVDDDFDGGVLEISIGGGAYQDILAAGGTFTSNGYNGTLNGAESNPLGVRAAWVFSSAGYVTTAVNLPAAAAGQNIVLRWRFGSGTSFAGTGWAIDTVVINQTTFACGGGGNGRVQLNADGNSDVFVYRSSTGNWYRENTQGGGGFIEAPGGWAPGWSVLSANFNGDALTDMFLFNTTNGAWFKLLNDGTGFTTQANGTWWNGWERYVMDLDGDGTSDVFLYDPVTGSWYKCIATPTGFNYLPGGWTPGWEIYPLKFNNDALEDFFLFKRSNGEWYWALSGAGAGFTYPQHSFWQTDWKFYPGDYNGDGLTDLLLHRSSTGKYYVGLTTAGGWTFTDSSWAAGWTPWVVDLDANGVQDLFLYNKTNGSWVQLSSNAAGAFAQVGGGFWTANWDLYATDFNNDGKTDWLLYNPANGQFWQAWFVSPGNFTYFGGTWLAGLTIVTGPPVK